MNKSNLKWLGRMGLVMLLVCGLDIVLVMFVPHPRIWVVLVSFLLPLLNVLFVMMPVLKQAASDKADSIPSERA